MANEQFLISGDQIATYSSFNASYPASTNWTAVVTYSDIEPLGTASDRFFLVRTQGNGSSVNNGDLYTLHYAVDDGNGGYTLGGAMTDIAQAQASTHQGVTIGDSYAALGMYYGDNLLLNLEGFNGATEFVATDVSDGGIGTNAQLQLDDIAAANPDSVPCFTIGTVLSTLRGKVRVEDLRPNDYVITLDHGPQPVRYISLARVELNGCNEHLRPVHFSKGSLGAGVPEVDICVSPQHRVLMEGWECELLMGHDQMLCPAKHLVNGKTVRFDHSSNTVEYFHLHFDRHEIVESAGMWSESFFSTAQCAGATDQAQQAELLEIFPDLHKQQHTREIARPVAKAREGFLLQSL